MRMENCRICGAQFMANTEEVLKAALDKHIHDEHGMVPQYVPPAPAPAPTPTPTMTIEVTEEEKSMWEQVKDFLESKLPAIVLFALVLAWPAFSQTVHSVTLSWTASTTAGVTYNVLHSAAAAGPFAVVNAAPITTTSFVDSTNTSGFWEVVAVDTSGDTSIPSSEASVPNPASALKAVAN